MKQISAPEAAEDALHLGLLKQLIKLSLSKSKRKRQRLPSPPALCKRSPGCLQQPAEPWGEVLATRCSLPPASSTSCLLGKEPPFSLFILIWKNKIRKSL